MSRATRGHYLGCAISDAHPPPSSECRRLFKLLDQLGRYFPYVRPQLELRAHCVQNVNSYIPDQAKVTTEV